MASCRDTIASPCLIPSEYMLELLKAVKKTELSLLCSLSLIFLLAIIRVLESPWVCAISDFEGYYS